MIRTYCQRFQSFENQLFEHMGWMDPNVWEDERLKGNKSLEYLANNFKVTIYLKKHVFKGRS